MLSEIQIVVLRQIGGRGHFRSRGKDGGHPHPLLCANFTVLSSIERKLLPIKFFYIVGIGNFASFCEK